MEEQLKRAGLITEEQIEEIRSATPPVPARKTRAQVRLEGAILRQALAGMRSPAEQWARLDAGGYAARNERAKLQRRLGKG